MANFMIRFLLCNVLISGIIGILFDSQMGIQKQLVQPDAV